MTLSQIQQTGNTVFALDMNERGTMAFSVTRTSNNKPVQATVTAAQLVTMLNNNMPKVAALRAENERLQEELEMARDTHILTVDYMSEVIAGLEAKLAAANEQITLLENRLRIREEVEAGSLDSIEVPF